MAKHLADGQAVRPAALLAQARRNERGEVPGTPLQRTTMANWPRSRAQTLMAQHVSPQEDSAV